MHAIRAHVRAYRRGDAGGITAEYALVTLAGAFFAGVLLKIFASDQIELALTNLIGRSLA
jgi:hypothetical protein